MAFATWIADVCRKWGLEVIEVDGWRNRGNSTFAPRGIVDHHTGGAHTGDMPSLNVLISGRSDLPGPLCNCGLSRSGKVYVVAAGRANHAGAGGWRGLSGNSTVLGIEAENDGGQPWPAEQLKAYYRLVAALMDGAGITDVGMNCGHKEWAPTRKVDPHSLDMNVFRAEVQKVIQAGPGSHPTPTPDLEEDGMDRVIDPGNGGLYYAANGRYENAVSLEDIRDRVAAELAKVRTDGQAFKIPLATFNRMKVR